MYFQRVIATVYETESINDIACVRDEMLDSFFFLYSILRGFFSFDEMLLASRRCWYQDRVLRITCKLSSGSSRECATWSSGGTKSVANVTSEYGKCVLRWCGAGSCWRRSSYCSLIVGTRCRSFTESLKERCEQSANVSIFFHADEMRTYRDKWLSMFFFFVKIINVYLKAEIEN